MKLWYKRDELADAQQEAQKMVEELNAEMPAYINGDVKIRMAWREDELVELGVASRCHIPEAEVLVNGEVTRRDLLDLIALDILALEMHAVAYCGFALKEDSEAPTEA